MNPDADTIRLLAIGAHPDDIEFGMGGVLLKELAAGRSIALAITSKGEAGSHGTPAQREREAIAAARQLGAADRLTFLDFGGDGRQVASPEHAAALARVIREVRPAMVFAPIPQPNQHPDHMAVGVAARDACRLARYAGLATLQPLPPHAVESLWFYSLSSPDDPSLSAAVLIDVSDVVAPWQALMACHQTQVTNRNYLELQLARARQLGLMAGCDYAIALWPNDPLVIPRISAVPRTARGF